MVFVDDLYGARLRPSPRYSRPSTFFSARSSREHGSSSGSIRTLVASQLDLAYAEASNMESSVYPGDPSLGWTFLPNWSSSRSLSRRWPKSGMENLLVASLGPVGNADGHLPAKGRSGQPAPSTPVPSRNPNSPTANPTPLSGEVRPQPAIAPSPRASAESPIEPDTRVVSALEQHAEVRVKMRQRLTALPGQSGREVKRLLTVWQFYVRLFAKTNALGGPANIERAKRLVVVAEIIVRWQAICASFRSSRTMKAPWNAWPQYVMTWRAGTLFGEPSHCPPRVRDCL